VCAFLCKVTPSDLNYLSQNLQQVGLEGVLSYSILVHKYKFPILLQHSGSDIKMELVNAGSAKLTQHQNSLADTVCMLMFFLVFIQVQLTKITIQ
jgi:hypothetical protein